MSFKNKCRNLLLIGGLAAGLLAGAPMRPEDIEELLSLMNRPKVVHVLRESKEDPEEEIDSAL